MRDTQVTRSACTPNGRLGPLRAQQRARRENQGHATRRRLAKPCGKLPAHEVRAEGQAVAEGRRRGWLRMDQHLPLCRGRTNVLETGASDRGVILQLPSGGTGLRLRCLIRLTSVWTPGCRRDVQRLPRMSTLRHLPRLNVGLRTPKTLREHRAGLQKMP